MLSKKESVLIFLLFCVSIIQFSAVAQNATAKATIQPVEIVIGQQSTINLEIIAPKGSQIMLPLYNDTLVSGIEVIAMPKADTIYAHEVMTITQKYIVTSFDSALYHVPYIPVVAGVDTIRSNGFGLKVVSPMLTDATSNYLQQLNESPTDSIDLDQLGLYDIKAIQDVPFVWQDYVIYGLMILSLILAIAAIIIGLYMYKKKKEKGYFFKPVVVEPPHVIALSALNKVKDEKLWQQGREKQYYTELTDILREYIEKRFHINAFEMTSDEILDVIKNYAETDSSYDSLNQVLKLSDLVKFAKFKPLPDENDLSIVNSILFVNQTKKEDVVPEPKDEKDATKNDDSSQDDDHKDDKIDWTISPNDISEEFRDMK